MPATLTNARVSVVLLGQFVPGKLMPSNLADRQVISRDDASSAAWLTLVQGQATEYTLPWGRVTCVADRLVVEASVPPYVRCADFVLKVLAEVTPDASAEKLGINREYLIEFDSLEERDEFGLRLVPPANWGTRWGQRVAGGMRDSPTVHGGMTTVTMREAPLSDRPAGYRDVQVLALVGPKPAAQIKLNDHYEVNVPGSADVLDKTESRRKHTGDIADLLQQRFESAIHELEVIANEIVFGGGT